MSRNWSEQGDLQMSSINLLVLTNSLFEYRSVGIFPIMSENTVKEEWQNLGMPSSIQPFVCYLSVL